MPAEWDLGPRVVGKAKYDELQQLKETSGEGRFGPRVTGPMIRPAPIDDLTEKERQETETPKSEGVSVKKLAEELAKDPMSVAMFFALEQQRPDRRKTALRLLGETEAAKGQPDMRVLAEINEALTKLEDPGD